MNPRCTDPARTGSLAAHPSSRTPLNSLPGLLLALLLAFNARAGQLIWSGAAATDTNWSNANNWTGAASPGSADDVKFFDLGAVAAASNINNVVDAGFGGAISSLQYGNTNNFHTTLIASNGTLNVTGANGLSVFMPRQDTATNTAKSVFATITGRGAILNVSNASANLVLNQAHTNSNGGRATLDLSGLDNFTATLSRIGIGTVSLPNTLNPGGGAGNNRCLGTLYLAKTNLIRLNYSVSPATYQIAGTTNALEMSRNPGNNSGAMCFLYLGRTNALFLDSLGVGRDKASATSAGWLGFNPAFTNSNPTAYFRGPGGDSTRVSWWGIGDMNSSGSSVQVSVGTCDFSNGSVDALVDVMSLARDGAPLTTAGANNQGTLSFTSGTIDVNTLYVGNQSLGAIANGSNFNPCIGVVNVSGTNATLVVNNSLVLGRTVTNSITAQHTSGALNINRGSVRANAVTVGTFGTNNAVNITGGTLVVTNTFGTNSVGTLARPLTSLALSNATLWLSIDTNAAPRVVASSLSTGGTSNTLNLAAVPVFPSYPTQLVVLKYTSLDSYNFGLGNTPSSAPGSFLVNNTANGSVDLLLTSGPTPAVGGLSFSQQPVNTTAGFPISPPVKVAVTNVDGSFATNTPVFISLLSGTGVLNGTLSQVTDANGVATFADLSITAAGTKTLRAATGGKTISSTPFNITAALPASLAFTSQPADTVAGQAFTPAVTVQLLDAYGNYVQSNGVTVNVALTSGTGTLQGTTAAATDSNGQATYANLSITQTGTKQLSASASGLPVATTSFFVILPLIPLPTIPAQTFFVTNYGAIGDGLTTNTIAIQNTINAAALAGGGIVRVGPGVYLSGPLNLSNNINLQIDAGAMLQMLPYGSWPTNANNFITCTRLHDIAISGEGTMDGQGALWWWVFETNNGAFRPHDMILMSVCTNILVETVTLQNPPNFHLDLNDLCQNVNIRHVTVNTPNQPPASSAHNTDGTDISANNCLIQYCSYNDGDDDPVLKGPAYNVTIADCNIGLSYGVAVGSTLANGGATNLYVVNCLFTNTIIAIDHKSDRDRGNLLRDFTYANLSMTNVRTPIIIFSYYTNNLYGSPYATPTVTPATAAQDPGQPVTATTPIWRNFLFSNITAVATGVAGTIWGLPEMLVSNVTLTGVNISATKSFNVLNARGVRFVDSSISTPTGIDNLELYNAELTISNSAPVSTPTTLDGFSTNAIGNTLSIYNAQAIVKNTNLFSANPAITLGASTLAVSNNLNLGAVSSLNFVLGTNSTTLAVASNLVLNGTINITAGGGFGPGTYVLFTCNGTLSGNPVLGSTPATPTYLYSLDTNTAGQVKLVVSQPSPPSFGSIRVAPGANQAVIMTGSGGVTNGLYYVLSSSNLALPRNQWPAVATNPFDAAGRFAFTNIPPSNASKMFYRLRLP